MGENKRIVAVVVSVVAVVAIVIGIWIATGGGDDEVSSATSAPTTVATSTLPSSSAPTTAPPTTAPLTTAPATTTPPTTAPATTAPATSPPTAPPTVPPSTTDPNAPCEPPTSTDGFNEGFPMTLSGLVGSDIRTGAHECFERVVIEFEGTGDMPGVRVEYVDDPVLLSPSDQTVEIEGDATLVVSFGAWMPSMEGDGYDGPTDITPDNVEHILQLLQIENFEGMSAWAIGLDEQRPFSVDLLDGPPRIVIDIAI